MVTTAQPVPMCKFYQMGACRKGAACPFSHDLKHSDSFACPYFAAGHCSYGDRCMYDHVRPAPAATPSARAAAPTRPPPMPSPAKDPAVAQPRGKDAWVDAGSQADRWRPRTVLPVAIDQAQRRSATMPPCAHFQSGRCHFGEHCRFRHVLAPDAWARSPANETAVTAMAIAVQQLGTLRLTGGGGHGWRDVTCAVSATSSSALGARGLEPASAPRNGDSESEKAVKARAAPSGDRASGRMLVLSRKNGGSAAPAEPTADAAPVQEHAAAAAATDTRLTSAWGAGKHKAWSSRGADAGAAAQSTADEQALQQQSNGCREAGLTILDAGADLLDPWEMSLNPGGAAPRRRSVSDQETQQLDDFDPSQFLCQAYGFSGECEAGEECPYAHGEYCDMCGLYCLHPTNAAARAAHEAQCYEFLEEMDRAAASEAMECSICMECVMQKAAPSDRKFGLLTCEHCFCLSCIRSWRDNSFADVDSATRTCPICRTTSHFVTPSPTWPRSEEEKEEIVNGYKAKLGGIHCRHFDYGRGTCPFGTSCFYRHELEDGTLQDRTFDGIRKAMDADGEYAVIKPIALNNFFQTDQAARLLRRAA